MPRPRPVPNRITYGREARTVKMGHYRIVETHHLPGTRLPKHDHEEPSLNIVLDGGFAERIGSRELLSRPGTLVIKPAGTHHANRYVAAHTISILVHTAVDSLPHIGDIARAFGEVRVRDGAPALRLARMLQVALRHVEGGILDAEDLLEELLLELSGTPLLKVSSGPAPPWLERIRERLVERSTASLSITELAGTEGVSLVGVAKAFRRYYGCTPRGFLRRVRIDRARAQLMDPSRALTDVALLTGFADQAHFTRSFKRETALTPGQYRRLVCTRIRP